ncbi:hypothetical protein D3C76_1389420 [compost metagenome]
MAVFFWVACLFKLSTFCSSAFCSAVILMISRSISAEDKVCSSSLRVSSLSGIAELKKSPLGSADKYFTGCNGNKVQQKRISMVAIMRLCKLRERTTPPPFFEMIYVCTNNMCNPSKIAYKQKNGSDPYKIRTSSAPKEYCNL